MATEYYQELIKRNLIEPTEEYSLTGYRCTMHDVVRTFAEYMAREESLVVVGREQAATGIGGGGMHIGRLSIEQTISVLDWGILQRRESLRTLIINSRVNFHLPGDSLSSFSCLRVLYIWAADSDTLVPSLSKLKHLRYLHLEDTDISGLPDDIDKMKFLRYIHLPGCEKLGHLPSKIIKLVHLRSLDTSSSNIGAVPKGFGGLINLRLLYGFPVQIDMDAGGSSWCSLQELAPLSQLRKLTKYSLEKVHDSRMVQEAMISSKRHLSYLELNYSASRHTVGPGGEAEQQQQQSVIEEVLEKLCPPTCIENLALNGGYAGHQLPNWMCAPASADFNSLRYLSLENLPCCIQLPDGLCCLPSLELLTIKDAPTIKRIGPKFQAYWTIKDATELSAASTSAPFPKLRELNLVGLREWEEWEWNDCEEHSDMGTAIAMPCFERLKIDNCKLSYLPPGLANSKRHDLRKLYLYELTNLTHVENFPSVVELDVLECPELKRISGLHMLQKIRILYCTKLEVLEGVPALDSLVLHCTMDTLPEYLRAVNPRYLELDCNKKLYESSSSQGSSEWDKISHIGKHNIICLED